MAVAGKTGTTDNDVDRWFAGYTPYYTAVVWCGYDYPEAMVLKDKTSDENPAVTMWQKVMAGIHQGLEPASFRKPTDVVQVSYCCDSGLLATEACRKDARGDRTVTGELCLDDVPTGYCTTHVMVDICGDHVANEYCAEVPGNKLRQVGMLDVERVFPISGIEVLDQSWVHSSAIVPPGSYEADAPEVDPLSLECYIHSEEDVPKDDEDDEDEENDGFSLSDLIDQWLTP